MFSRSWIRIYFIIKRQIYIKRASTKKNRIYSEGSSSNHSDDVNDTHEITLSYEYRQYTNKTRIHKANFDNTDVGLPSREEVRCQLPDA
jgi:hypothetical protein